MNQSQTLVSNNTSSHQIDFTGLDHAKGVLTSDARHLTFKLTNGEEIKYDCKRSLSELEIQNINQIISNNDSGYLPVRYISTKLNQTLEAIGGEYQNTQNLLPKVSVSSPLTSASFSEAKTVIATPTESIPENQQKVIDPASKLGNITKNVSNWFNRKASSITEQFTKLKNDLVNKLEEKIDAVKSILPKYQQQLQVHTAKLVTLATSFSLITSPLSSNAQNHQNTGADLLLDPNGVSQLLVELPSARPLTLSPNSIRSTVAPEIFLNPQDLGYGNELLSSTNGRLFMLTDLGTEQVNPRTESNVAMVLPMQGQAESPTIIPVVDINPAPSPSPEPTSSSKTTTTEPTVVAVTTTGTEVTAVSFTGEQIRKFGYRALGNYNSTSYVQVDSFVQKTFGKPLAFYLENRTASNQVDARLGELINRVLADRNGLRDKNVIQSETKRILALIAETPAVPAKPAPVAPKVETKPAPAVETTPPADVKTEIAPTTETTVKATKPVDKLPDLTPNVEEKVTANDLRLLALRISDRNYRHVTSFRSAYLVANQWGFSNEDFDGFINDRNQTIPVSSSLAGLVAEMKAGKVKPSVLRALYNQISGAPKIDFNAVDRLNQAATTTTGNSSSSPRSTASHGGGNKGVPQADFHTTYQAELRRILPDRRVIVISDNQGPVVAYSEGGLIQRGQYLFRNGQVNPKYLNMVREKYVKASGREPRPLR